MLEDNTSDDGDNDSFFGDIDAGHCRQGRLRESVLDAINACVMRDNLSIYEICGVLEGVRFTVMMSSLIEDRHNGEDLVE